MITPIMNSFQPNLTLCDRDNIALLLMCRKIIENNAEMKGCVVRQPAAIEATLGAYLDFWYNSLPLSVDDKCNPICVVTPDGCYVAPDGRTEAAVVEARLNTALSDVVDAFIKCKESHDEADGTMSIDDVIDILKNAIAEGKVAPEMLCGGKSFYQSAERSIQSI